jgi:GNAT superfamily N-acetyltransferase
MTGGPPARRGAVTVADCERVQASWFRTRAQLLGGEVWTDGPLTWTDGPDGQNLVFPCELTADGVRRGADRARERGASIVGAWLSLDVDPGPLADAGFDRGWSPWWMVADLADVAGPPDPRVGLQEDTEDDGGEQTGYPDLLALTRERPACAWYAAAHAPPDGRLAGSAWSFLDGDLAGVFDMEVWRPFQRRGFGTGLLRAVCAAAGRAGARAAVLNATPEGKELYQARGFTQIGEGITWWLHLR